MMRYMIGAIFFVLGGSAFLFANTLPPEAIYWPVAYLYYAIGLLGVWLLWPLTDALTRKEDK